MKGIVQFHAYNKFPRSKQGKCSTKLKLPNTTQTHPPTKRPY